MVGVLDLRVMIYDNFLAVQSEREKRSNRRLPKSLSPDPYLHEIPSVSTETSLMEQKSFDFLDHHSVIKQKILSLVSVY